MLDGLQIGYLPSTSFADYCRNKKRNEAREIFRYHPGGNYPINRIAMEKIGGRIAMISMLILLLQTQVSADPRRHYGGFDHTSIGVRLGWVGAPNGFTYRRAFDGGHAFEMVVGYNPKYGRRIEGPLLRKGNSFISFCYAPNFTVYDGNVAVGLYGSFGARINVHHYRSFNSPARGFPITPDLLAGFGMQIEFNENWEIFGDMHVKYFSVPGNYYAPGVESGAGIRFWLN